MWPKLRMRDNLVVLFHHADCTTGVSCLPRSLPFTYTSSAAAGDMRELVVDEAENKCLGGFVVESFDHLD